MLAVICHQQLQTAYSAYGVSAPTVGAVRHSCQLSGQVSLVCMRACGSAEVVITEGLVVVAPQPAKCVKKSVQVVDRQKIFSNETCSPELRRSSAPAAAASAVARAAAHKDGVG